MGLSVRKVRKDLSADSLFRLVRARFDRLADPRAVSLSLSQRRATQRVASGLPGTRAGILGVTPRCRASARGLCFHKECLPVGRQVGGWIRSAPKKKKKQLRSMVRR